MQSRNYANDDDTSSSSAKIYFIITTKEKKRKKQCPNQKKDLSPIHERKRRITTLWRRL
jgi:hypothetical protein